MSSCAVSTSLLVSTGAVSCYHASMVNFIWFTDQKYSSYISTTQHGDMKSGILRSKNSAISQTVFADALCCWKVY